MKKFRIVAWNVRASMTARVMDELCADPTVDLYVLSEYRVPKAGDLIAARLAECGWSYSHRSVIPAATKGVALFSRTPLKPADTRIREWTPRGNSLRQWITSADVPAAGLSIIGAYVPFPDGPLKEAVWSALVRAAKDNPRKRLLIAGDFNSCHPHDADTGRGYTTWSLDEMKKVAYDLWSLHNPSPSNRDQITWHGPNGMGNRIDFAFGTDALRESLLSAVHRHEPRISNISDHSQLVVDLRVPTSVA
jgi:exonuclease III